MAFLRIFDPKGFKNNYKGSNWREVEGPTKVDHVEQARAHKVRHELDAFGEKPIPADTQGRVNAPGPGEEKPGKKKKSVSMPEPEESTIEKMETPTELEKDITGGFEFYGPGELTGIADDMMVKKFSTVKASATVAEASEMLSESEFFYLPVMSEKETICGLVTEDQIFRKLVQEELSREKLDEMRVEDLMISPVLCCMEGTPIKSLLQVVLQERVGCLPVVNNQDRLVGIVTKNDLLQYILESPHFFDQSDV